MAYKVFQNGFQLPASDLNNYFMNQSVITFADATARAAAITSPVEGMLTYLESTNSYEGWNGSAWTDINDNTSAIPKSLLTTAGDTIYATGASTPARLALGSTGSIIKSNGSAPTWLTPGTSGQVLTSSGSDVSWSTPAAGGGLTLLSTTTLSGSATNITGISQAYKQLFVSCERILGTTNGAAITCNALNSSNTEQGITWGTDSYLRNPQPITGYPYYKFTIHNYSVAGIYHLGIANGYNDMASAGSPFIVGVRPSSTDAIYGLRFSTGAGSLSGTVKIYGVN